MTTQLQAVYENGVLRPLQPIALAAQCQCVTITITEQPAEAEGVVDETHFVLSPSAGSFLRLVGSAAEGNPRVAKAADAAECFG